MVYRDFNSHTREGVTLPPDPAEVTPIFQLTHPWGCDGLGASSGIIEIDFNSHTREGVTFSDTERYAKQRISTHTPVRVWPRTSWITPAYVTISTHTPVRVWLNYRYYNSKRDKFQLTHPWGCDAENMTDPKRLYNFNSHTREGVTKQKNIEYKEKKISTHTPVRVWL